MVEEGERGGKYIQSLLHVHMYMYMYTVGSVAVLHRQRSVAVGEAS